MQFSGFSHGQYIRWCTAAEPKSHSTSSPVRVYSAYRHSLSRVHSPMATPVRYLMLLLSKTSSAPSPALSIACRARSRRYWRSRPKSSRSSKSTYIRPGAGATGSAGTAMGAPVLVRCSFTVLIHWADPPTIQCRVQWGCQASGLVVCSVDLHHVGRLRSGHRAGSPAPPGPRATAVVRARAGAPDRVFGQPHLADRARDLGAVGR